MVRSREVSLRLESPCAIQLITLPQCEHIIGKVDAERPCHRTPEDGLPWPSQETDLFEPPDVGSAPRSRFYAFGRILVVIHRHVAVMASLVMALMCMSCAFHGKPIRGKTYENMTILEDVKFDPP